MSLPQAGDRTSLGVRETSPGGNTNVRVIDSINIHEGSNNQSLPEANIQTVQSIPPGTISIQEGTSLETADVPSAISQLHSWRVRRPTQESVTPLGNPRDGESDPLPL